MQWLLIIQEEIHYVSLTKPGISCAQLYSLVIMMNRKTAEKIAAIVLLGILVTIFVIQNAHALSTTCPGFVDNVNCLTIEKQPYQFGYYDGKQAGLIAFYQVDDSCDSTAPASFILVYVTE
jgi:hypothetical protein